jgi:hypothetical protein
MSKIGATPGGIGKAAVGRRIPIWLASPRRIASPSPGRVNVGFWDRRDVVSTVFTAR